MDVDIGQNSLYTLNMCNLTVCQLYHKNETLKKGTGVIIAFF